MATNATVYKPCTKLALELWNDVLPKAMCCRLLRTRVDARAVNRIRISDPLTSSQLFGFCSIPTTVCPFTESRRLLRD